MANFSQPMGLWPSTLKTEMGEKHSSKHLDEDRGRTVFRHIQKTMQRDSRRKHAKQPTTAAHAIFTRRSHSYLSRDFNSDFIKNLIHDVLAFLFIIRAIKDVIQGVVDLEGKEREQSNYFQMRDKLGLYFWNKSKLYLHIFNV